MVSEPEHPENKSKSFRNGKLWDAGTVHRLRGGDQKARHTKAKTWEGDFYFITEKGRPVKEPLIGEVDLYHGKCRKVEVVTDTKKYSPEFIISAPYRIWKRICLKQLDFTHALITKQSKLMTGSRITQEA